MYKTRKTMDGYKNEAEPLDCWLAICPYNIVIADISTRQRVDSYNYSKFSKWGRLQDDPSKSLFFFQTAQTDEILIFQFHYKDKEEDYFKYLYTADYLVNAYINLVQDIHVDRLLCDQSNEKLNFVIDDKFAI